MSRYEPIRVFFCSAPNMTFRRYDARDRHPLAYMPSEIGNPKPPAEGPKEVRQSRNGLEKKDFVI